MKRFIRKSILMGMVLSFILVFESKNAVQAEDSIALTALGSPYVQDFDTLSNSGESEFMPQGWFF